MPTPLGRLLVGLLLWAISALAVAATPEELGAQLIQRKIGASPAQAFYLGEALRRNKRPGEAAWLERYLLEAYVEEVAGKPHDPSTTVAQAAERGRALPPLYQATGLRARWSEQLEAKLAVLPADDHRALPGEIEAMAAQLSELAPGVWQTTKPGFQKLYLALSAANRGQVPLPATGFELFVRRPDRLDKPDDELRFECTPERDSPSVVVPGKPVAYLCRAESQDPDLTRSLPALRANPDRMRVVRNDFSDERSTERIVRALSTLGRADLANLPRAVEPAPGKSLPQASAQPSSGGTGSRLLTDGKFQLMMFVVVGLFYFGVAKMMGNIQASILCWLLGTGYVGSVIASGPSAFYRGWEGLAMMFVYGFLLCVPLVVATVYFLLFEFVTAGRETIMKTVAYGLMSAIGLALLVLLGRLGA